MPRHPQFTEYDVFCTNLPVIWKSTRKVVMSEIAPTHVSAIMEVIDFFKNFLSQKHTKGRQKRWFWYIWRWISNAQWAGGWYKSSFSNWKFSRANMTQLILSIKCKNYFSKILLLFEILQGFETWKIPTKKCFCPRKKITLISKNFLQIFILIIRELKSSKTF